MTTIEAAFVSSGNMKSLATGPRWARYGQMISKASRIRGYGDFLHYHLLAAGKIDVVIETDINILDIAACVAIVTEAGGRFTDLERRPHYTAIDFCVGHQRTHARSRAGGAGLRAKASS